MHLGSHFELHFHTINIKSDNYMQNSYKIDPKQHCDTIYQSDAIFTSYIVTQFQKGFVKS